MKTPASSTRARYLILLMLFVASSISYGDRAALAIAGPAVSRSMGFDSIAMGYILSAFAISYVIAQVPGGALLDRYGARWIYTGALLLWSFFTLLQGWTGVFSGTLAVAVLFALRLVEGAASAPAVPANARIAATWFPTAERGSFKESFGKSAVR